MTLRESNGLQKNLIEVFQALRCRPGTEWVERYAKLFAQLREDPGFVSLVYQNQLLAQLKLENLRLLENPSQGD